MKVASTLGGSGSSRKGSLVEDDEVLLDARQALPDPTGADARGRARHELERIERRDRLPIQVLGGTIATSARARCPHRLQRSAAGHRRVGGRRDQDPPIEQRANTVEPFPFHLCELPPVLGRSLHQEARLCDDGRAERRELVQLLGQ